MGKSTSTSTVKLATYTNKGEYESAKVHANAQGIALAGGSFGWVMASERHDGTEAGIAAARTKALAPRDRVVWVGVWVQKTAVTVLGHWASPKPSKPAPERKAKPARTSKPASKPARKGGSSKPAAANTRVDGDTMTYTANDGTRWMRKLVGGVWVDAGKAPGQHTPTNRGNRRERVSTSLSTSTSAHESLEQTRIKQAAAAKIVPVAQESAERMVADVKASPRRARRNGQPTLL